MDKKTKPSILVKKDEAKKGSLWHDVANQRIFKQHGGFDIPDDDRHAIHKYESPLPENTASPEETNATLTDIENKIKHFKEIDEKPLPKKEVSEEPDEYFED